MTKPEDFTRFENFIDDMTDIEYDYWYENEASPKQKQLSDTIREEVEEKDVGKEFRKQSSLIDYLKGLFKK